MLITQSVKLDVLNKDAESIITCRTGETGRGVEIKLYNSETGDNINLANYNTISLSLHKPDGNLIVKALAVDPVDSTKAIWEMDEQDTPVSGLGYFDVNITAADLLIYSTHGKVLFDTPVSGYEEIDSVSLIYGLRFPDDFQLKLTAGANITITEDNVISSTGGGGGGTGDYQDLINKPRINNVILSGNKTASDLGLATKTSDLLNDSGFITAAVTTLTNYYLKTETYTQAEVNALIGSISTLNLEVVAELPDHDISTTTIYLVPKDIPGTEDVYDEYIYVGSNWEHIGSTTADLTNYYTKSQVDTLLSNKVDKEAGKGLSTNDFTTAEKSKLAGIEAGAEVNVQADWNQTNVDAPDYIKNKPSIGVYTAGNGIDITNNRISVNNQVLNQITETAANLGHPPTYDSTASYNVGDVCSYDGYSYKCNTAITGGEVWDSSHWDATDAYAEIDTLNQNLTEYQKKVWNLITTLSGTTVGSYPITGDYTEMLVSIITNNNRISSITLPFTNNLRGGLQLTIDGSVYELYFNGSGSCQGSNANATYRIYYR